MENKNFTSEINKNLLNSIFPGTYHFASNALEFDATKKYKSGDVFFYGEKIFCIHEDYYYDTKKYSKSYHRQFGGVKIVEKREIIAINMSNLEKTIITIDSFRGDFLRKSLDFLPKKQLSDAQLAEKARKERERNEKPICLRLAKKLGYCEDGINNFVNLFNFDIKKRYSVVEFLEQIYENWELRLYNRRYDYVGYIIEIVQLYDIRFDVAKFRSEWSINL